MNKKRLLFASSEVYPFVKTGGLGDVSYSLPKVLSESYEVEVILPLYQMIDREQFGIRKLKSFEVTLGESVYSVELHGATLGNLEVRFIYTPLLCDREFPYGLPECGYEDNGLRFALFSKAVSELLREGNYTYAHLNDWQCALVALWVKEDPLISTKTLYTIHNLAYQGVFDRSVLGLIGIDESHYTMEGLEFYDQVNFAKAGIAYADVVTTVSPTYAKEILTPEFGCGLEGFLATHRHKLSGILNGIDTELFSPSTDSALVESYSTLKGKKSAKSALMKQLGLKGATKPLFVFIGRFTHQKGMDILVESLPKIAAMECNIALLGEGEGNYNEALGALSQAYPNIALSLGYDESLSRQMYAAGDYLLMPSLFEPCGLNQMIAYAYGAIPIVSRVGGLVDTVKKIESFDPESKSGFGIVIGSPTSRSLVAGAKKGCELYAEKKTFEAIGNHNMQCDYSWSQSVKAYLKIYKKLSQ
jgi:starch synthase